MSIQFHRKTSSSQQQQQQQHPFNSPLSGTTWVSWYQKGKTSLDLLEQETVSGSDISWDICKSAPRHRQPRQHPATQFFTGWMPFLPLNQQHQSTEGKENTISSQIQTDQPVASDPKWIIGPHHLSIHSLIPQRKDVAQWISHASIQIYELKLCSHIDLQTRVSSALDNLVTLTFKTHGQCTLAACHGIYTVSQKKETLYSCPYLC